MTVVLRLQNDITDTVIPGDFNAVMHQLNHAASLGMVFVLVEDADCQPVALNVGNINSIRPGDDDALLG